MKKAIELTNGQKTQLLNASFSRDSNGRLGQYRNWYGISDNGQIVHYDQTPDTHKEQPVVGVSIYDERRNASHNGQPVVDIVTVVRHGDKVKEWLYGGVENLLKRNC